MNNPENKDLAEYLSLKAANDELRERGKKWLWNALDVISSEVSRELAIETIRLCRWAVRNGSSKSKIQPWSGRGSAPDFARRH